MRIPKIFYGWWIIVAGSALGSLNSGFYYYGFGAFFTPIINEFGWSRAELSGAFSIARFEAGLIGPIAGAAIDRLGARRVAALGVLMIGAGFILIVHVNTLFWFYVVFIFLMSVGQSMGTSMPAMAAVSNWFSRRRGMALGILLGGFGVGGALGPTFLGWLIGQTDWRTAAVVAGLIFWVVGFPASLVIRLRPEEKGLLPDGDPAAAAAKEGVVAPAAEVAFTPRQALASNAFWILSVVFAIRQMLSSAIAVHEVAFFVDRGYTLEAASAILGTTILVSISGRVFWGWLGDRWDRRWVLALCHILLAVGVFILTTIPDAHSPVPVALFLVVFGVGYGGTVPVSLAMIADFFGRRNYATIQGMSSVVTMFGNIIGPFVAGYMFDVSQSYALVFVAFGVVTLAGLPPLWWVRKPSPAVSDGLAAGKREA